MDGELHALERAARATPDDARARIAYATALSRIGHRAAAAHEAAALERLGAPVPRALREQQGELRVVVSDPRNVAPADVPDLLFPGALVGNVPLVMVESARVHPCRACGGRRESRCALCSGTGDMGWGTCPDCMNGVLPCPACHGLGAGSGRPSPSSCAHDFSRETVATESWHTFWESLLRCRACGLPAVAMPMWLGEARRFVACARCNLFGCACEEAPRKG